MVRQGLHDFAVQYRTRLVGSWYWWCAAAQWVEMPHASGKVYILWNGITCLVAKAIKHQRRGLFVQAPLYYSI